MKYLLIFLFTLVGFEVQAQESIRGTWYRNDLFATATLKVSSDLHFHMMAFNTAHSGEMDGNLTKVKEGLYYCVIRESDIGQDCIMVFELNDQALNVKLFGDEVGAGYSVYFEGKYERQTMPHAEYVKKALDWILNGSYDQKKVEKLLGSDLDYFIQCFEMTSTTSTSDDKKEVVREGFLPGVANYQNGVFAVTGGRIYILFLDCRQDKYKYQYFTNDATAKVLPPPLSAWIKARDGYPVVKHVLP